ncbi:hypothetical protein [Youngiibacter fragilis]|uniref:Histone deacetylase n=1 Tax=Youngiibacter fragilis 232.1 TaxID=994573 RepID=V7I7M8_9CLOT|nr:hypothetical protein [Youngiibacter fragilis]ETA81239.1 histone deacetylase [Youngiibacter fragilis 232.1]
MDRSKMVWYAVYGSNLLFERFMTYLKGGSFMGGNPASRCNDTTPPRARLLYELQYDMYFGNSSSSWEGKGVSFLDITKPGKAYSVAYLVSREQFDHICRQENGGKVPEESPLWYDLVFKVGEFDGIPMMTLTNSGVRPAKEPGGKYLEVLKLGLMENYPYLTSEEITDYLFTRNAHR